MDLESVLASVEDEGVKENIANLINAEKQKGVDAYGKKDKEVLKLKNQLKEVGYDKEKFDSFEAFKSSVANSRTKSSNNEVTIATLNEKVDDLLGKYNAEKQEKEDILVGAKSSTIKAKLEKEIGHKLYSSEYIINANLDSFDVVGNAVVGKDDVSFADAIAKIMDDNKESIKVGQTPGAETKLVDGQPQSKLDFAAKLKAKMSM